MVPCLSHTSGGVFVGSTSYFKCGKRSFPEVFALDLHVWENGLTPHSGGGKTRLHKHNDPIFDPVGAGANMQRSSFHSEKLRFRGETAALPSCRDTPDRAACSDAQTQHLSSFCHKCLTFFFFLIFFLFLHLCSARFTLRLSIVLLPTQIIRQMQPSLMQQDELGDRRMTDTETKHGS